MLGAVGQIYAEHDLLADHEVESWSRLQWQRYPSSTDGLTPDDIADLLSEYTAIGERLGEADRKVGKLEERTKRAQAQELWEEG